MFKGKMAGRTGLEPAASCVTGRRYNQLNYRPMGISWADIEALEAMRSPGGCQFTLGPRVHDGLEGSIEV